MARFEPPQEWGQLEPAFYYDSIGHENQAMINDPTLAELFHDSFFNSSLTTEEIRNAREELQDYCINEYDFDFWDEWDWEIYREFYGEGAI